jgi:membrane protein required for colicin V production
MMTWVDWAIVLVLVVSVLGGLAQGFFRASCSLCGLLFGLVLAAWNYGRVAAVLLLLVRIEAVADVIGFLLIALVVMGIANLAGTTMARALHWMGLGCLDSLAGGAFGFLQGALFVMLCILVTVAFFPRAHWLVESRLPRLFFGACHVSTHMSPQQLADKVRDGLRILAEETPRWMHPGNRVS